MDELQKIKIKMESTDQYGNTFSISQEVPDDFCDFSEMEIYHNVYMNFLRAVGFCFNLNDKVIVLKDNEYVDSYCDGDCDNCSECDEEDI